jgi:hypothetical protein
MDESAGAGSPDVDLPPMGFYFHFNREMVKVLPLPGVLSTSSVPRCCWMTCRVIESPIPNPL